MKKLFFLIATISLLAPAALAQEVKRTEDAKTITIVEETNSPDGRIVTTTTFQKNSVFTNGFWHNWELLLGGGAQLYYGDNDKKFAKWTEMVNYPAVDLYLTKWASPSFGVGIGANYSGFTGLYQSASDYTRNSHFRTNELYTKADSKYDYEKLAWQRGQYANVFALAHVDLWNAFFGYNPDRIWSVDAFAGGGYIFGLGLEKSEKARGASFNAGLANKIRLGNRLSLLINLRGAIVSDDFDGEGYTNEPDAAHVEANIASDGIFGVTAGLAWKLGKEKSKWERASRSSTIYYNDAALARMKDLENELAAANAANANLRNELLNAGDVQVVKEVPDLWFHINFIIDRWDLLSREKVNLQSVADIIKSTPSVKYLLCGYADKQTATPSHNLMLSKNRVEAVYDFLTKELGVNPDQLVTDYKGGVDYMFYDEKELSRCCMITAIKE